MELKSDEFIAVDLHVHTPASNCYKWEEDTEEEAYINLLRSYKKKDIKVIAITDHNSIEGYNKLIDMKNKSRERLAIWSELESVDAVKEKIKEEKEKIELFDSIVIMPGIEFEANPGIHILLIFNPDIEVEKIEKFLSENGYPKELQGKENVEVSTRSAIEIVKEAYDLGAITIAAHVDSSKGAGNVLKSGSSKAQFFKCEKLMGLQVVSLSSIDYYKKLYKNKEYKRKMLPAFIRCSDYHGNIDEVEKYVTYMKLSSINFEGIKEAIYNSIECLSFTKNTRNSEIIKSLIDEEGTYKFLDFSEQYLEDIKRTMCSILNFGRGTIVIGVKDSDIFGIKKSKLECKSILKDLIDSFGNSKAFFRYKVDYYEFGNHIVVVVKLNSISNHIYELNSKVYIEINKKITAANPNQLVMLGEEKFKKSFEFINSINKRRIDKINKELIRIKELEENIGIYKSVINNSLYIKDVFDFELLDVNVTRGEADSVLELFLGESNGDKYFVNLVTGPHTNDAYLRLTCPRSSKDIKRIRDEYYDEECIVIAFGGAVHYIQAKEKYSFANTVPIIKLKFKDEFKDEYSLKAIASWFKSPILLYLIKLIYGSYDLFNPKIFVNIPIIMSDIFKKGQKIDCLTDQIMVKEKYILDYFNTNFDFNNLIDSNEDLDTKIREHNKSIGKIAIEIEKILKEYLLIKENEEKVLNSFINYEKWTYFSE